MKFHLLSAIGILFVSGMVLGASTPVLIEAEGFAETGVWVVDPQFMDTMGSPYLLAHGLGVPVVDAQTTVVVPAAGRYRMWVRTMDWVARWNAPGTPGRFQVLVNGEALETTFGTVGAEWHWQDGGMVTLQKGEARLALHHLTGLRRGRVHFTRRVRQVSGPQGAAAVLDSLPQPVFAEYREPLHGGAQHQRDARCPGGGPGDADLWNGRSRIWEVEFYGPVAE